MYCGSSYFPNVKHNIILQAQQKHSFIMTQICSPFEGIIDEFDSILTGSLSELGIIVDDCLSYFYVDF
jgi:hypothetical protein